MNHGKHIRGSFDENIQQFYAVNYIRTRPPSSMLDWVQNTPVISLKKMKTMDSGSFSWYKNLSIETLNDKIIITSLDIIIFITSVTNMCTLMLY